jgi:hypothetical protein
LKSCALSAAESLQDLYGVERGWQIQRASGALDLREWRVARVVCARRPSGPLALGLRE